MSWISDRLGIHVNLRPLAAPAGALLGGALLGPAGAALGAGLFKTADNKAHGDSWGHALGQGALNAGLAYGMDGGLDKLRSVFGGGGGAAAPGAAQAAAPFTPGSVASASGPTSVGGITVPAAHAATLPAMAAPSGGGSFLDSIGHGAASVGRFAKDNPTATAMALQGVGQLGTMGSENAYRKAQANALNLNNQQTQYELDAKKRRDEALAPLYAALQGQIMQMQQHPYQIASNPYTR